MSRSVSFLLLAFGVVAAAWSGPRPGAEENSIRIKRFIDISEIPDYDIFFWPVSSTGRKSSKKDVQAIVIEPSTITNITTAKKRIKGEVAVGVTGRPIGRITVKPGPEIIVPITVKPNIPNKPTGSSTAKPQGAASSNGVKATTKPTITTLSNKKTVKPSTLTVTSKPISPQKIRNETTSSLSVSAGPNKVTQKPVVTTVKPIKQKPQQSSGPCSCVLGVCTCCSGPLLGLLSQKACIKVIYIPEDFTFDYSLMLNNNILYQNRISGKNPRPACIGIPRFNRMKLCARFSNVYFAGRNVHFCMGLEGRWDYEELFSLPFDCVRMGAQGFAIVKPEEGGGISIPGGVDSIIDAGGDDIGEYDENVVRTLFDY